MQGIDILVLGVRRPSKVERHDGLTDISARHVHGLFDDVAIKVVRQPMDQVLHDGRSLGPGDPDHVALFRNIDDLSVVVSLACDDDRGGPMRAIPGLLISLRDSSTTFQRVDVLNDVLDNSWNMVLQNIDIVYQKSEGLWILGRKPIGNVLFGICRGNGLDVEVSGLLQSQRRHDGLADPRRSADHQHFPNGGIFVPKSCDPIPDAQEDDFVAQQNVIRFFWPDPFQKRGWDPFKRGLYIDELSDVHQPRVVPLVCFFYDLKVRVNV